MSIENLQEMFEPMPYSPPTKIAQTISATDTVITVEIGNNLPDAPNVAVIGIDEHAETIIYRNKTGNVLSNCIRGVQRPDEARVWSVGAAIARNFTAKDLEIIQNNLRKLHEVALDQDEILATTLVELTQKLEEELANAIQNMEQLEKDIQQDLSDTTEALNTTLEETLEEINQTLSDAKEEIDEVLAVLKTHVEDTVSLLTDTLEGIPMVHRSALDPMNFDLIGDGSPGRPVGVTIAQLGGGGLNNSASVAVGPWIYIWTPVTPNVFFRRINIQHNTIEILNSTVPNTSPSQLMTQSHVHMSYHDGFIYLLGTTLIPNGFIRYSIVSDTWEVLAFWPHANAFGAQGGWINNQLHIMGQATSPTVIFTYDLATNAWTPQGGIFNVNTATMPGGAINFANFNPAVVHDNWLYFFGPACGRWNPITNTAERLANPPATLLPIGQGRAFVGPDGGIWIQRFNASAVGLTHLLRYDISTNTWINFGTRNIVIGTHSMVLVGDILYYFGHDGNWLHAHRLPSSPPLPSGSFQRSAIIANTLDWLHLPLQYIENKTIGAPVTLRPINLTLQGGET